MNFQESIRICLAKYKNFTGRASRAEFWLFMLFANLCTYIVNLVGRFINDEFYLIASFALALALLLPCITVTTRRLHDINRSGSWQLLMFIPIFGWIVLIYFLIQASKEPNRFGPPATSPLVKIEP